ncbi:DivIVA domain-containing protein [Micromonospora sp. NPDC048830]|uniref:DivIVA domain-containing protein n=1 Tax=Micromonospora sp. NPDC048830 TaxID=3364257 RepID=UPI00371FA7DF
MRDLIRRLTGRRETPRPTQRARPPQIRRPLRPSQIRHRHFNERRRGLDPVEIRSFLHEVADELAVAQRALVAVQEENVRIKNALRSWQSAQAANRRYR